MKNIQTKCIPYLHGKFSKLYREKKVTTIDIYHCSDGVLLLYYNMKQALPGKARKDNHLDILG